MTLQDAAPAHPPPGPKASLIQPVAAGLLAAAVGFGSTFTVVLAGFTAVGATPAQAASGLVALCVVQGLISIVLSLRWRLPISVVWSTPGFALMLATGTQAGGFGVATGAFVLAALLIVAAGLYRPLGRLVDVIPPGLANAMLAGVLFEICLAPVHALQATPTLVLPIVAAWVLALRFARRFAIPIAVLVTALIVVFVTKLPPGAFAQAWPQVVVSVPRFTWGSIGTLVLPLFIVTMASQNVPGLAVLRANGYQPDIGQIFVATGAAGIVSALGSGGLVNLAAITAALCAGPEAHPDPAKRYVSTLTAGLVYVALGLFAGVAAVFVAAAPPSIIEAVAGLALMGSFAGALSAALSREADRIAVAVTFVTAASGVSLLGIGAAFWGLVAGGTVMAVDRLRL